MTDIIPLNVPQTTDPQPAEPAAAEADVIRDWLKVLWDARKLKALAEAKEREAREVIISHLGAHGADLGTVAGKPVLRVSERSREYPPSVSVLRKVAPEIQREHGTKSTYVELRWLIESKDELG